jgi:hypothetical protein
VLDGGWLASEQAMLWGSSSRRVRPRLRTLPLVASSCIVTVTLPMGAGFAR